MKRTILFALSGLLLAGNPAAAQSDGNTLFVQKKPEETKWEYFNHYSRWSLGVDVGVPFFSNEFRARAYDKTYWGGMVNLNLGYQITPVIGARLSGTFAKSRVGARSWEQDYILGPDSWGYYGPIADAPEGYELYKNLYSKVAMWGVNLHFDINVLNLFRGYYANPDRRWSVLLSPGVYFQKFSPQLYRKNGDTKFGYEVWNPMYAGVGGEATVRYKVNRHIDLQVKGGANWTPNNKFDGVIAYSPDKHLNCITNFSVGFVWKINANKKRDHLMYAARYVRKDVPVIQRRDTTLLIKEKPVVQEKIVEVKKIVPVGELPSVNFVRGRSEIDEALYAEQLAAILKAVKNTDPTPLRIYGFADHTGNDEINDPLSQARAEALRDYLVNHGVDSARIIEVRGMGADRSKEGEEAYSVKARRSIAVIVVED